jgi:hypothetical protein
LVWVLVQGIGASSALALPGINHNVLIMLPVFATLSSAFPLVGTRRPPNVLTRVPDAMAGSSVACDIDSVPAHFLMC